MSDASVTDRRIVEDTTCLGCGCLCDDITLVVEQDRIAESRRACGLGLAWYERARRDPDVGPMIAGQSATLDRAIGRAAEVLAAARAPVVLGLGSTIESQRAAVAIADRIGAAITPNFSPRTSYNAFRRLGTVASTFGEVRDRADVIVFDAPLWPAYFPRFLERFVDAPGRFVPEGRAGRTVIHVRVPTAGAGPDDGWTTPPDLVFDLPDGERNPPGLGEAGFAALRGLVNGVSYDPARFEAMMGLPLSRYADLAGRLRRAKYGALISMSGWPPGEIYPEPRLALVRDLNRFTRFVTLSLPRFPREAGAEAVLAWQAGAADDVDLALGHPRHLPHEVWERIERAEADAILLVGDLTELSRGPRGHAAAFAEIPKVVVGPVPPIEEWATRRDRRNEEERSLLAADAFVPTARAGIDEGGTVARSDGVMLPLRPPFPARRPPQADVLRAILARLEAPRNLVP